MLNNLIPAPTFTVTPGNDARIGINLLGMVDPSTQAPRALDASNAFVTESGVLQGIKVGASAESAPLKVDVVFIVDNAGSMGEEADSVASRISAFAAVLERRHLDVRVGCVGHGARSDQYVYGALNLGTASRLR